MLRKTRAFIEDEPESIPAFQYETEFEIKKGTAKVPKLVISLNNFS